MGGRRISVLDLFNYCCREENKDPSFCPPPHSLACALSLFLKEGRKLQDGEKEETTNFSKVPISLLRARDLASAARVIAKPTAGIR